MGIYKSGLSVWQRNKAGLPMDHASDKCVIGEEEKPVVEEKEVEVEKPVEKTSKPTSRFKK